MAASVTSAAVNIQYLDNVGIQLVWTGTPSGTFAVQFSLDFEKDSLGNILNAGTWTAIDLDDVPTASGSAGNWYLDMNQISSPWIRIVYTRASGTGSLSAYVTGKEV